VDVRDNTTASNGCLNEGVQLFVSANSELQMARGDALYLEVLACVTSQLEYFSGKVLQDSSAVYSSGSTNALREER
jgi:hypothetical protein